MTQEMTRGRADLSGRRRSTVSNLPWHGAALAAVLILSAFLNLYRITALGYANTYYAAAVKDMLKSWHNFFFVSFDAGFVSVDKPPLGLWIQAASAWLFGFHGWSLLLPQALAGVASVALLYHLVGRTFGRVAGLISALALALTPIVVATSRNNTADMLLVFALLVAAWAVIRAVETGKLGWLLLCAVVVGLGFNIKMMQAFLVLPAFYFLYLLVAPVKWWRRFVHLALATVVLLVVSFSWATAVELTPAKDRPYVGSSTGNSVYNLILGYNGFQRLLGNTTLLTGNSSSANDGSQTQNEPAAQGDTQAGSVQPGGGNMVPNEYGAKGPLRLFNQNMAGQISWLLPLALIGAVAVAWRKRIRFPLDREQQALVLWGTWTLTTAAYFSVASEGHRYYLVMLAPGLAALVGAGAAALWRDYRGPGWRGWGLLAALAVTAAAQAYILSSYAGWSTYLTPAVAALCLAAALLVAARLRPKGHLGRYATVGLTAGLISLFIAPAAWASYTVVSGSNGTMPSAGPQPTTGMSGAGPGGMGPGGGGPGGMPPGGTQGSQGGQPPAGSSGAGQPAAGRPGMQPPSGAGSRGGPGNGGPGGDQADASLIRYLEKNQGDARYLVAGTSAMSVSPIILSTDEPVIDLGGFQGRDPVFTVKQVSNLVAQGKLKYFLIQDAPGQQPSGSGSSSGPNGATSGGSSKGSTNSPNGGSASSSSATPPGPSAQEGPPQGASQMPEGGAPQAPEGAPPPMQQGTPPQMPGGSPQGNPPAMPGEGQQPGPDRSGTQGVAGSGKAGSQGSDSRNSGTQSSGTQSSGARQAGSPTATDGGPSGGPGGQQTKITNWVQNNCKPVPQSKYESSGSDNGGGMGGGALYVCSASDGSSGSASAGSTGASPGDSGKDASITALANTSATEPGRRSKEARS